MARFSAILKKNRIIYNKNTGSNYPHPLAQAMAFLVAHPVLKKFFFQLLKI